MKRGRDRLLSGDADCLVNQAGVLKMLEDEGGYVSTRDASDMAF
jgi:hypothetical protein